MSTREEEIRVKVTGTREGERDLDRLAGAVDDVGDSVATLGKESGKASKKVDDLGDQARGTASQMSRLERQIADTRTELHKLNDEYEKTGDAGTLKKLQGQQSALAKLEATSKRVAKLNRTLAGEQDNNSTSRVAKTLASAVQTGSSVGASGVSAASGLAGAGGPIGTALTVGVTAGAVGGGAVPALAAAGGAVLGAGAIGAVAGGVAGASMGPRGDEISAEFNGVLDGLRARFIDATTSWVDPTLSAIDELGNAVKDIPIEGVFSDAAGYLEPLTKGLTGFLTGVAGGVDDLVRDAGPIVDMLGTKLPDLGGDIGDSLRIIGAGAPGAAAALGDVLDIVGGLTKAFAGAAAGAGMLYEKAINTPVLKQGHDLFMSLFDFKDLPISSARALDQVTSSAYNAAAAETKLKEAVDTLNSEFERSFGIITGSIQATSDFEAAQDGLTEGWKRGKGALDASNEAGRTNIGLALDYVEGAKAVRDAAIAAGDGSREATAKANGAYEAQIQKLEGILVKLGVSKEEAHKFAQQFLGLDGMTVDTYIKVHYRDDGLPTNLASRYGGTDNHAGGGTAMHSGNSWVGERGPEIRWLNKGEYVSTAAEAQRLSSTMSRAGTGGGRTRVTWAVGAGADTYVGQLIQRLFDGGMIQVFADGEPVTTRR